MYCKYDVFDKEGKKDSRSADGAACLASVFYSKAPCSKLVFYVGVDNVAFLKTADWFEKKVINPLLIDRVKDAFTVEKGWPEDQTPRHEYLAWRTITFDGSKISPADCYMLVCLYRYPQEFPDATKLCQKYMMEDKSRNPIEAYINSHHACANGNHSILNMYGEFRYVTGLGYRTFSKWNLKEVWEKLPEKYEYANGTLIQSPYKGMDFTDQFDPLVDPIKPK
jgi:hypothetical protein